jgi:hypothetical protein
MALPSAQAALVLGSETTNQGGINVSIGANTVNFLSVPEATTYGNTLLGGLATLVPPPQSVSNYNFYDDYIISIPTSGVNSVSSTIDFGELLSISKLQVRLYAGSTPSLSPATTIIDAWSSPITSGTQTGIISVLPLTALDAGDYVLEVRGLVDGESGGSYAGVLNVATVPLPGAALLLGSAVGLFGMIRRRQV